MKEETLGSGSQIVSTLQASGVCVASYLGLRSSNLFQPRVSNYGPSALNAKSQLSQMQNVRQSVSSKGAEEICPVPFVPLRAEFTCPSHSKH
jgi:hypothetical protein